MSGRDLLLVGVLSVLILAGFLFLFSGSEGQPCQHTCDAIRHHGRSVKDIVCCMPSASCEQPFGCLDSAFILKIIFWLAVVSVPVVGIRYGMVLLFREYLGPIVRGLDAVKTELTGDVAADMGKMEGALKGITGGVGNIGSKLNTFADDTAKTLTAIQDSLARLSPSHPPHGPENSRDCKESRMRRLERRVDRVDDRFAELEDRLEHRFDRLEKLIGSKKE